jgi:hypothetical protein
VLAGDVPWGYIAGAMATGLACGELAAWLAVARAAIPGSPLCWILWVAETCAEVCVEVELGLEIGSVSIAGGSGSSCGPSSILLRAATSSSESAGGVNGDCGGGSGYGDSFCASLTVSRGLAGEAGEDAMRAIAQVESGGGSRLSRPIKRDWVAAAVAGCLGRKRFVERWVDG